MSAVKMTQTVKGYTSGSSYWIRAREAVILIANNQATAAPDKKAAIAGKSTFN